MADNPYKAYLASDAGDYLEEDQPIAIGLSRSAVFSNAMFAAESAAQVRIKAVAPTSGDFKTWGTSSVTVGSWYVIYTTQVLVHLHPSGGAFRFRVRLKGASSQTSITATFRIGVGLQPFLNEQLIRATAPDNVAEFSSAVTGVAWLGQDLLTVPIPEVDRAIDFMESVTDIGGVATGVPVCKLDVAVIGKVSSGSGNTARLHGLIVEEFIGT